MSWWHRRPVPPPPPLGTGLSFIIPILFTDGTEERQADWAWLEKYWTDALPGAEIIIGHDTRPHRRIFSKSAAINDGFRRSHGDILVIADSDAYLHAETILLAAKLIREARADHQRLWIVPYRRFYRLQQDITRLILRSDPAHPLWPTDPPEPQQLQWIGEKSSSCGHWFGALCQVMPREAFNSIGGWDERFEDWGGEDVSMMRAVDTVWARHRTLDAPAFHLYHPSFGTVSTTRTWAGGAPGNNDWLSTLYDQAIGDRQKMLNLRRQTDT